MCSVTRRNTRKTHKQNNHSGWENSTQMTCFALNFSYIIKDNQPVVDTYISEYELIGRYIVGSRRKSEFEDAPVGFISTKYGNFILNTRTGELRESVPNDEFSRFKSSIKKPK